jgi:hypothetical protein
LKSGGSHEKDGKIDLVKEILIALAIQVSGNTLDQNKRVSSKINSNLRQIARRAFGFVAEIVHPGKIPRRG